MVLAVEAWAEILEDIAVGELQDYYKVTMKSRESTFPLGADEIAAQWRANQRPSFMAPAKPIEW